MTTIGDVAKAAGVSVATVSRALRGVDRVSPRTRERVMAAAADLHYVASPAATIHARAVGSDRPGGVTTRDAFASHTELPHLPPTPELFCLTAFSSRAFPPSASGRPGSLPVAGRRCDRRPWSGRCTSCRW